MVAAGHGALEPFEDARLVVRGDADAFVPHGQPRLFRCRLKPNPDRFSRAERDGVLNQIRDYLLESKPVPPSRYAWGFYVEDTACLFRARPVSGCHVTYDRAEIDTLHNQTQLARRYPRKVEELGGQLADLPICRVDVAVHVLSKR